MSARKVLVTITAADGATGRGAEGVRAALGLARAFEGHHVRVLFRGAGVQWLLPREEKAPAVQAMLGHLYAAGVPCFAESAALGGAAVGNGVQAVDEAALRHLAAEADACLNY